MSTLDRTAGMAVALCAAIAMSVPAPLAAQASHTDDVACGTSAGVRQTCTTGGTVANVEVVRDLSGRCRRNATFGHTGSQIWTTDGCRGDFRVRYRGGGPDGGTGATMITCGRSDGTQVECRTGGYATSVRLVRSLGQTSCTQGRNWGHTDSFIWTNRGCMGQFEVTYQDGEANAGGLKPRVIDCGTTTGDRVSCNAFGSVASVRIVRELSNRRCRQGRTWGFSANDLWTTGGCRAQFEVTYRGAAQPR
jgi:hypothetical protein